jgi:Flp pilus assembly pilin Flp
MPSLIMRAFTSLLTRFRRDESGALVPDLAKAAIAISFLSVVAANVISNRIDASEKSVMAAITADAAKGRSVDTSSTGSLARNVNATKIDPCALPAKR